MQKGGIIFLVKKEHACPEIMRKQMKIIMIGNGTLGDSLIEYISREDHSVTVIDEDDDVVNAVVNKYDVLGVCGSGASIETQKEAGVETADVVISVVGSDELNLLCCMIAKRLGARHTIARVRDPRYLNQQSFMRSDLGIDVIINPEYESAREAAKLIRFPAAVKLEKLAQGKVEIVEIYVGKGHPFVGQPLIKFKGKYDTNALVCAAKRGEDVIIPGGDYVISEGDTISLVGSRADITDLFVKIGLVGKQLHDIVIIGGESTSRYLAKQLLDGGFRVKIIEQNAELCEELSEQLPKATMICGDPADPDLLDDEGLASSDACVVMTPSDQRNFIISMFAKTRNVKKIISSLSSHTFVKLAANAAIDSNITPGVLVASKVLRYIRGLAGMKDHENAGQLRSLHKLVGGRVEALEFDVTDKFDGLYKPLRSIKLKKELIIAALIRGNNIIYPNGETSLMAGDSVIVMTTNENLCDLDDILA